MLLYDVKCYKHFCKQVNKINSIVIKVETNTLVI